MSAEIRKELEELPTEVKFKRYRTPSNRISKCPEVDIVPDEF